ncbi:MAG TPA: succinate dehydrogenase iron-sulfur subunit [Acidobacteriota bacterium]|nr:succinate dehydrogenase iron-sulfur subunit [Acidobacteriota bacterium]
MTFKILRFEPQQDGYPHFQVFRHEPKPQDTVLEALKDIRDQQDPSLSFRYSCREAVCGSCSMVINGRIALACRTQVSGLGTDEVVIEPLPNLEILKDLIVDLKPFWEAYRRIEPYLQAPGEAPEKGHRVAEKDMERVFQYITCILCACCYSACPAATRDARYAGPAALAKLYRFTVDPRDRRPFTALERVDGPEGVWGCDTVFRCNDVCPKAVRPADGIEGLRRKLIAGKMKRLFGRKP